MHSAKVYLFTIALFRGGSVVGTAIRYMPDGSIFESRWQQETFLFFTYLPWGRRRFVCIRYRVIPGGERPRRGVDHPPYQWPLFTGGRAVTLLSRCAFEACYRRQGLKNTGRLNSLQCYLIFLGPLCGTCFVSPRSRPAIGFCVICAAMLYLTTLNGSMTSK